MLPRNANALVAGVRRHGARRAKGSGRLAHPNVWSGIGILTLAALGACQASPTEGTPSAVAEARSAWPPETPIDAEALFIKVGCTTCHANGAPYETKILQAKGKPRAEVAAWIRDAPSKLPGTPMPSFADRLGEREALALAEWLEAIGYRY